MVKRSATLDEAYGALAHAVRRRMLDRLKKGEARVTELAEPFAITLAAASKHIRVLERAGLIKRKVVGRDHLLSLNPAPLAAASGWIDRYRLFWEGRLDELERQLRKSR